jgi:hypothetical protein
MPTAAADGIVGLGEPPAAAAAGEVAANGAARRRERGQFGGAQLFG